MTSDRRSCGQCHSRSYDKGRATDGRRAYRCACCGCIWTEGLQGRAPSYSPQRQGYQFADSGATPDPFGGMTPERSMAAVRRMMRGSPDEA